MGERAVGPGIGLRLEELFFGFGVVWVTSGFFYEFATRWNTVGPVSTVGVHKKEWETHLPPSLPIAVLRKCRML